MITWLATYPRSGNTLLRTLLYQTMGQATYSDELTEKRVPNPKRSFEHLDIPGGDWPAFYGEATRSRETYLVKTHRPPRDAQPAIYVIRDGRSALTSYAYFHRDILKRTSLTLLDLVLGLDYYGGWSEHYEQWTTRKGPVLLLTYDGLVEPSDECLTQISRFIGRTGDLRPWANPFDALHQRNPKFFRQGHRQWKGDPEWTPTINGIFFHLHGKLMAERGYATPEEVEKAVSSLPPDLIEMANAAQRSVGQVRSLRRVASERQEVINRLRVAYEERLSVIHILRRLSDRGRLLFGRLRAALRLRPDTTKTGKTG